MPIVDSELNAIAETASVEAVPSRMKAAVYRGDSTISVEDIPVPFIGDDEILVRVHACGVCHTDLKKVEYNLLPPPRVYGHETAGVVAAAGRNVRKFQPGDRVIAFHHIPCLNCFYCHHKLYAQCPLYKKVGITAGFEPAGGGFSQYVRLMDWIVERGVEKIPDGVSFERASFVEPLNTCLKAVTHLELRPDDVVAILGQGPIGLMFTMLAGRTGATVVATDAMPFRRQMACRFGAASAFNPRDPGFTARMMDLTDGRGADAVIVAASAPGIVEQAVACSRPGSRILLFAQTSHQERVEISGADVCVGERAILGCYSASVDVQRDSAQLVFRDLPVEELVTHRFPLNEIQKGIHLAMHPEPQSLKVVIQPQRWG